MPCNAEQQRIIDDFLTNPAPITLIQGKAGSGKSYLIRELVSQSGGSVILVPTNMAKSVYSNAQTMHSFFYGEFDDLEEGYQNPKTYSSARNSYHGYFVNKLRPIRTMIIDEISMVRADTFEMMNVICQETLRSPAPFGGIKVILVGDMFQLPPIVEDEETGRYLKDEYGGYYFFNSHVIQKHLKDIRFYELKHSVRHGNDPEYERILDNLRRGCPVDIAVPMLDRLNSRVVPLSSIPPNVISIASSNAEVLRINHQELAKLPGQEYRELAVFTIKRKDDNRYTQYTVGQQQPDEKEFNTIEVPSKFESDFMFKVGARVMFTESRKKLGYVNGDFGTIVRKEGSTIYVRIDKTGDIVMINRVDHYRYQMKYDDTKRDLVKVTPYVQKTNQYPLKLACAFTIHKSQGQTYEQVVLDLHSHIFASGQLYVALSRVKTLNGLYLTKPVSISDIIVDKEVVSFMSRYDGSNVAAYDARPVLHNTEISSLRTFVVDNESLASVKTYIEKSLSLAESLYANRLYPYAALELVKTMVILEDYYFTDKYAPLVSAIRVIENRFPNVNATDCEAMTRRLAELYKILYRTEHRTVVNDKR